MMCSKEGEMIKILKYHLLDQSKIAKRVGKVMPGVEPGLFGDLMKFVRTECDNHYTTQPI